MFEKNFGKRKFFEKIRYFFVLLELEASHGVEDLRTNLLGHDGRGQGSLWNVATKIFWKPITKGQKNFF